MLQSRSLWSELNQKASLSVWNAHELTCSSDGMKGLPTPHGSVMDLVFRLPMLAPFAEDRQVLDGI